MSDRIQNIFNGLLGMFTQDPSRVPIIDKGTYPNVPNVVSTVVPRDLTRVERLNTRIPPPIDISPTPLPTPTVPRDVERDAMEQTILDRANQPSGVMPLSTGVTATPMSGQANIPAYPGRPLHDYTDFDMLTPKGQQEYGGDSFGRNMPTTPSEPIDISDKLIPPTREQGILNKLTGSIQDFVYPDGEVNWGLVAGLNQMTMKPDPGISAMAAEGMKESRKRKVSNKTAQQLRQQALDLRKQGKHEDANKLDNFANDVESGIVDGLTAWKVLNDPKTPLVQIGDNKAKQKKEEFAIKSASDMIATGNQAQQTIAGIERLMEIGQSDAFNEIPNIARGFVPTGLNKAIDMYQATLVGVAKGQRTKGEGPMSDKDIVLLLENVGSISMSPEARLVAQIGLKRNMERKIQLQKVANDYMADKITRAEFYELQQEYADQPIFTDDERDIINNAINNKEHLDYDDLADEYKANMTKEQYASLPLVEKYKFHPNWKTEK